MHNPKSHIPPAAPAARSYRCYYAPKDPNGWLLPAETGVLPFIQVLATDAEDAQRKAHHVTGCPIANVERLEPVSPFDPIRAFCAAFDDTVAGALA